MVIDVCIYYTYIQDTTLNGVRVSSPTRARAQWHKVS